MNNITKEKLIEILNTSYSKLDFFRNLGYKVNKSGINQSKINQWNKICHNFNLKDFMFYINHNREKKKTSLCKNCGKAFIKSRNKLFCCKRCANLYNSKVINESSKKNRLIGTKQYYKKFVNNYYNNPSLCAICGSVIPYNKWRYGKNKTCSKECAIKLRIKNTNYSNCGGYRENGGYGKHGWYKGIYCDSTYELAYVIYCLDNNIPIKRCEEVFEYQLDGVTHKYHPDFVVNNEIIEIKGYDRGDVEIKKSSVGNKKYKILYRYDLIPMFEYVSKKYNKKYNKSGNNFHELYDASIV